MPAPSPRKRAAWSPGLDDLPPASTPTMATGSSKNAWKRPIYPPAESSRRTFTTTFRLTLTSSGRVADVRVLIPSGYEAMDRSVLAAVNEAMFPPFPSSLGYPSLPFTVEMVLTPD